MRILKHISFTLAFALSLNATLPAAPPAPAPKGDGEIVELPTYTVVGKRILPPPESWRYARVPAMDIKRAGRTVRIQGFEILSNDWVKNARELARELQLRLYAGALFWPNVSDVQYARPPVIMVDRYASPYFDSDEEEWRPLQWPEADTFSSAAWREASPGTSSWDSRLSDGGPRFQILPAGLARATAGDGVVIINMQTGWSGATIENVASIAMSDMFSQNVAQGGRRLPRWLVLGFQRMIQSVDTSWAGKITLDNAPLGVSRAMVTPAPLKIVLEGSYGMPPARPGEYARAAIDAAEMKWDSLSKYITSVTFVQFCLFGDGARYARGFLKFVERAGREQVTEEMFKECSGISYAKMDRLLLGFGTSSAYTSSEFRSKPKFPRLEARQATQTEIACLKALEYQVHGEPDHALETVRVAYMRGERTPRLIAELAYLLRIFLAS